MVGQIIVVQYHCCAMRTQVDFWLCVPTLNAGNTWNQFRCALSAQTLQPSEILVLDSTSSDATVALAQRDGCRVVTIPRIDFRHGATRQHAADLADSADVLVYLTQDSILADANALSRLISAFRDPTVGAAYGRQLPRPGANPIEAHARLFNYPPVSAIRSFEDKDTMGFKSIFFSNSFGAYRRAALLEAGGFPSELNFGEDTAVTARLLQNGWRIAYVAEAQTYHSHSYSRREEYQRYFEIGRLHAGEPWMERNFGKASGHGRTFVLSEIRYLTRHAPWLIPEAILRTGMKYLGYQHGRRSIELAKEKRY